MLSLTAAKTASLHDRGVHMSSGAEIDRGGPEVGAVVMSCLLFFGGGRDGGDEGELSSVRLSSG